ncbi:YphA family membrane protein [Eubacterium ramulus]|uniref:YphA family membrane protein n=1 Tax=Eubacterium ramulus TaxID=39490 RepID=UPI003C12B9A0
MFISFRSYMRFLFLFMSIIITYGFTSFLRFRKYDPVILIVKRTFAFSSVFHFIKNGLLLPNRPD